jgi:muconolactone delta-isomerase
MQAAQHFIVEMTLKPVPADIYQQLGHAEIAYTKEQIDAGKLTQLLVTADHQRYWMLFAVTCEQQLKSILEGFPLYTFFDYSCTPVMDMVAAARAGLGDPNIA